ncbi:winged helix-turn-helix transcriptional regulator [Catenulispora sp. GP43]|uniref:winged helix-turn-helix transcriptional regulator n=1 Tax=Catenulispora sp. GP43 TaxID=3156263 RepID=UPI003511CD22
MDTEMGHRSAVSAGVEVLGDRWTLLVLREMLLGETRFNDIHRAVPEINRSLLSARLRRMRAAGLVERVVGADDRPTYLLTPAGAALRPLIDCLGYWAQDWVLDSSRVPRADLGWLLWRLRQLVRAETPPVTVVVEFTVDGESEAPAWLVLRPDGSGVCAVRPTLDPDVRVVADLSALRQIVDGEATVAGACRTGTLRLTGLPGPVADFFGWFRHAAATAAPVSR